MFMLHCYIMRLTIRSGTLNVVVYMVALFGIARVL